MSSRLNLKDDCMSTVICKPLKKIWVGNYYDQLKPVTLISYTVTVNEKGRTSIHYMVEGERGQIKLLNAAKINAFAYNPNETNPK